MTKIIIARHGYSKFNDEGRFSGQFDVELTALGEIQAKETAEYVVKNFSIDKIYSSDLVRAYKTAQIVSTQLDIPVIIDKNLRELDVGKWQGLDITQVRKLYTSAKVYYENIGRCEPDGGEKFVDFIKRCESVFGKIATENPNKTVFVSTHGGVIRALKSALEKVDIDQVKNVPRVSNSSISIVEYQNGQGKMVVYGYDEHLKTKTLHDIGATV